MKIREEIFNRRCDAAKAGNEDDVRFYDDLLTEFEEMEDERDESKRLLAEIESDEIAEFVRLEEMIDELENQISSLKAELAEARND